MKFLLFQSFLSIIILSLLIKWADLQIKVVSFMAHWIWNVNEERWTFFFPQDILIWWLSRQRFIAVASAEILEKVSFALSEKGKVNKKLCSVLPLQIKVEGYKR